MLCLRRWTLPAATPWKCAAPACRRIVPFAATAKARSKREGHSLPEIYSHFNPLNSFISLDKNHRPGSPYPGFLFPDTRSITGACQEWHGVKGMVRSGSGDVQPGAKCGRDGSMNRPPLDTQGGRPGGASLPQNLEHSPRDSDKTLHPVPFVPATTYPLPIDRVVRVAFHLLTVTVRVPSISSLYLAPWPNSGCLFKNPGPKDCESFCFSKNSPHFNEIPAERSQL